MFFEANIVAEVRHLNVSIGLPLNIFFLSTMLSHLPWFLASHFLFFCHQLIFFSLSVDLPPTHPPLILLYKLLNSLFWLDWWGSWLGRVDGGKDDEDRGGHFPSFWNIWNICVQLKYFVISDLNSRVDWWQRWGAQEWRNVRAIVFTGLHQCNVAGKVRRSQSGELH